MRLFIVIPLKNNEMSDTKKIQVQILNAFVDNNKGGNPAGVVLDADNLSDREKLQIASKVGLSETAFVSKSKVADFKLDFFTPTKQIAHCGHATIAAFSYLKQLGKIETKETSKETIDGNRRIKIEGDSAFMEQTKPSYTKVESKEIDILKSLRIERSDLVSESPILLTNTGNSFVIISVKTRKTLQELKPDFELISKVSDALDLIGYYVFTTEGNTSESDAQARMFAPRYGIKEESGTGMAAGPLASYLYDIVKMKQTKFKISQGQYMSIPSPSLIEVELWFDNEEISGLMAGGKGILASQMEIDLDVSKS